MIRIICLVVYRYWREILSTRHPSDAWLIVKALRYVHANDEGLGTLPPHMAIDREGFLLDDIGEEFGVRRYCVYNSRADRRIGVINRVPSDDPWFDRPTFNVKWA
jgi:hypothetical protein